MSGKHGFYRSGMSGAAALLVLGSSGCWNHSAVGFHARVLGAEIDSDVTRARAVYCAERAREHRSSARAYAGTRNVLFGVVLAGVGTGGAALAADKAADGELGNDALSAVALTGLVGAFVALVGGVVTNEAASTREEEARAAIEGGAVILALNEQRRAAKQQQQQKNEEQADAEDEEQADAEDEEQADAEDELSSEELAFRKCLGGESSAEVEEDEPSAPPKATPPARAARAEAGGASGKGAGK